MESAATEKGEKPMISKLLSEAVLYAALVGAAYLIFYLYQASYLDYFGIPMEFVSVAPSNLLKVGTGLLTAAVTCFAFVLGLVGALGDQTKPNENHFWNIILTKWGAIWLMAILMWVGTGCEKDMLKLMVIPLIATVQHLVGAWIFKKNLTYNESLIQWSKATFCPQSVLVFGYSLILSSTFFITLGAGAAKKQETFATFGNEVVIARFDDALILSTYDPVRNQILRKYRLQPLNTATNAFVTTRLPGVTVELPLTIVPPPPVIRSSH